MTTPFLKQIYIRKVQNLINFTSLGWHHVGHAVFKAMTFFCIFRSQRINKCRMKAWDTTITITGPHFELFKDKYLVLIHLRVKVPSVRRIILDPQKSNRITFGRDTSVKHVLYNNIISVYRGGIQYTKRIHLNGSLHCICSSPPVDVLILSHLACSYLFELFTDIIFHYVLVVFLELLLIAWEVRMNE